MDIYTKLLGTTLNHGLRSPQEQRMWFDMDGYGEGWKDGWLGGGFLHVAKSPLGFALA